MALESKIILVVDDEKSMCEMLEVALKKWGYRVKTAHTLKDGVAALERGKVHLVLSDVKLPDGTGVELLNRLKGLPENPPVLLMTAFGNTDAAIQAIKLGAFYYLTKPFKLEELELLLNRALEGDELKKENEHLRSEVKKEYATENILGKSKPIERLIEMIMRVAKTKTNILITGESGTGKELIARSIHYSGILKGKPFVAVNCGAIPETLIESELFGHKRGSFTGAVTDKEGLFQTADGGTIFLDEIGELPMTMQVKLLRVLQDKTFRPVGGTENKTVDVRVISATNRNLTEEVKKNKFREDLFYRLNVIHIHAPPLRERKEDIPLLMEHFLRKYSLAMGKNIEKVSPVVMQLILDHPFPGNVRELENLIERTVALEGTSEVTVHSLPAHFQTKDVELTSISEDHELPIYSKPWEAAAEALSRGKVNLEEIVGELEKEYILKALEKTGGVKKKAAEILGITFRSIRYRITKHGIHDVEGDVDE